MYLTNNDFSVIQKALKLIDYTSLSDENRHIVELADIIMWRSFLKQKEANEQTAKRIAEKRKTNKNYCR